MKLDQYIDKPKNTSVKDTNGPKSKRKIRTKEKDRHFNFSYFYLKFKQSTFTTVRGKTYMNKFNIGDTVFIEYHGKLLLKCKIINKELTQVKDLSLDFMKKDGEYNDKGERNIINDHLDFISLLNEFRRFNKATMDSEITILTFNVIPLDN